MPVTPINQLPDPFRVADSQIIFGSNREYRTQNAGQFLVG